MSDIFLTGLSILGVVLLVALWIVSLCIPIALAAIALDVLGVVEVVDFV